MLGDLQNPLRFSGVNDFVELVDHARQLNSGLEILRAENLDEFVVDWREVDRVSPAFLTIQTLLQRFVVEECQTQWRVLPPENESVR